MKPFFLIVFFIVELFSQKPDILLLGNYSEDLNVSGWYMSEKLDGVRAFWDGEKLISRGGNTFNAPKFFIKDFPKHKLDGELWNKRDNFSNIVSIVKKSSPHNGWKNLTYNVFEVPNTDGNLTTRLSKVKTTKYLKLIPQIKIKNQKHLKEYQKSLEDKGAEGVVVRDGTLSYYTGRAKDALKVKSYEDDECVVVGYKNGKGKYKDKVGAFLCQMKNEKVIKIGSGLSDNLRENPPKLGSEITFKYYGLTSKGNPRFPVFMRIRELKK
jgi:DNA ligase-1